MTQETMFFLWRGNNTHPLNTHHGYFSNRVELSLESSQFREYLITSFNEHKFVTRFLRVLVTFVSTPHPSVGGRAFQGNSVIIYIKLRETVPINWSIPVGGYSFWEPNIFQKQWPIWKGLIYILRWLVVGLGTAWYYNEIIVKQSFILFCFEFVCLRWSGKKINALLLLCIVTSFQKISEAQINKLQRSFAMR